MLLVAGLADDRGQRLTACFKYHDVYASKDGDSVRILGQLRSISPGVVRAILLTALGRGWQASQTGLPPFRVYDAEQLVPVISQDD